MAKENTHDRHRARQLASQPASTAQPKTAEPVGTPSPTDHENQSPVPAQELTAIVARTVEDILNLLETPCQAQVEQTPEGFIVTISSPKPTSLLGSRGSTALRAIEHVTWMVARRHSSTAPPVYIEVAGHRKLREDFLRKKAMAIARIVTETGREMAIDMLSGPEQAIVRDALKNLPGLRIHAVGTGLRRTVVVAPYASSESARSAKPSSQSRR